MCGGLLNANNVNPIPDYYNVSMSFNNLDSGASGNIVTWENYPGESPAFSGGTRLTGAWTPVTTGTCALPHTNGFICYQMTLAPSTPFFERLYYNGGDRMRPRLGATAVNLLGLYGHSTSPYPSGTATSSGAVLTNASGDGFSALAANETIYYAGSCSTPTSCPYTVASVGGGGTTVTLHTSPPTQSTAVNYHAYQGMHYSTASSVNGIPNTFPAVAYASCLLATIHDCRGWMFDKWISDIMPLNLIDTTALVIGTTCGTTCPGEGGPGGTYQNGYRYSLENFKEGVAFGGQWYLDRNTSPNWTLTYVANTGENPNTDVVVVGSNAEVFSAQGWSYGAITGLNFLHDNWTVPATGYLATQQEVLLTNAAVACDNCNHVSFTNDVFGQTTTTGFQYTSTSANNTFQSNIMYDVGAFGMRLGFTPSASSHTATDVQVPNNNTVTQNWITGYAHFFPAAYGLGVGLANTNTVTNNDVGYGYNTAIGICQPGFPAPNICASQSASSHGDFNLTVNNNDLHNVGEGVTTDLGGVYAQTGYSTTAGSATGNVLKGNRIHDVNSSAVNGDTVDPMGHCIYLDGATGLWDVENNLCYRQTGMAYNMNFGPQFANQGNTIKNNIGLNSAATPNGTTAIRVQSPLNTVLEFTAQSNIFGMGLASQLTANAQTGPPATNSPTFQNYISNIYSFAGTPKFNIVGHLNLPFSTWQGTYGEDTAGTISTNPGFAAPNVCPGSSTVPQLGCDNFSFANGIGPGFGFVSFPQVFGPMVRITPPVVADTFPIAILTPAQFTGMTQYYVNPLGSDSNNGLCPTSSTPGCTGGPWQSICKADAALALGAGGGAQVNLAAGTYDTTNQSSQGPPCYSTFTDGTGHTSMQIATTHLGTASQRIMFTGPMNYWKQGVGPSGVPSAKIVGNWYSYGNFVDVRNIELTNPYGGAVFTFGQFDWTVNTKGNYSSMKYVYAHDVGNQSCMSVGGGATAINIAYRVHDDVIDSVIVDKSDVPYGCAADTGNGGYCYYIQGPHNQITNSMGSNCEGGGLSVYHNVCYELVANNVFVHNGVRGFDIAYEDPAHVPNEDCTQDDYDTVIGNVAIDNGWTCGNADSQNQGQVGAFDFYSTGVTSTHNTFAYNAGYNNWSATGNRNCINSPGTNNTLFLHNSATPLGNATTLTGNSNTGLVITFGDSDVPVALGGTSNFQPLSSGPLFNAVPSTANANYCAGVPGFTNPCLPPVDLNGNYRNSVTSIGAYK